MGKTGKAEMLSSSYRRLLTGFFETADAGGGVVGASLKMERTNPREVKR